MIMSYDSLAEFLSGLQDNGELVRISATVDPALELAAITDRVANRKDAWPQPAEEMVGKLDLEVIYTRTDWKDPKIQERLKAARLCEILIPEAIPLEFIRNAS